MTTLVVLFNLREDASTEAYERWARETDLPNVRRIEACERFEVLRTAGMLGSDDAPPYTYVEVIEVSDLDAFRAGAQSETMQRVVSEFRAFADKPLFLVTESIEA